MKISKFKLVYLLKGAILLWFLFSSISEIIKFSNYFRMYWGSEYDFKKVWFTLTTNSLFRPVLFLMPPIIGLFLNNRIGWTLITSYFYFLLINLFIQLRENELQNLSFLFFFVLTIFILLSLILTINLKKIRVKYYRINSHLVGINTIAFMIGLNLSLILLYLKNIMWQ
jgi:hypothetical protein